MTIVNEFFIGIRWFSFDFQLLYDNDGMNNMNRCRGDVRGAAATNNKQTNKKKTTDEEKCDS